MGVDIRIIDSNFTIPHNHLDNAYKVLCHLNTKDEFKNGGWWGSDLVEKPQDSTSVATDPNKRFCKLDWNYDETCKSTEDILNALGFETKTTQFGDLEIVGYEDEMGDENVFLEALAPFVEDGSYLQWINEDDLTWKCTFELGMMFFQITSFFYPRI